MTDLTESDRPAHRHLLGIEGMTAQEITALLDLGDDYLQRYRDGSPIDKTLLDRTQINLFFEDSTRTRTSSSTKAIREPSGDQVGDQAILDAPIAIFLSPDKPS